MDITGRLENWVLDASFNMMWGEIYDDVHNRWWNGAHIHTSTLKHPIKTEHKEGDIIQTRNSTYLLGKALR